MQVGVAQVGGWEVGQMQVGLRQRNTPEVYAPPAAGRQSKTPLWVRGDQPSHDLGFLRRSCPLWQSVVVDLDLLR